MMKTIILLLAFVMILSLSVGRAQEVAPKAVLKATPKAAVHNVSQLHPSEQPRPRLPKMLHSDQCQYIIRTDCLNNTVTLPRGKRICAQIPEEQLRKKLHNIGGFNPMYTAMNKTDAEKFPDPRWFFAEKPRIKRLPKRYTKCKTKNEKKKKKKKNKDKNKNNKNKNNAKNKNKKKDKHNKDKKKNSKTTNKSKNKNGKSNKNKNKNVDKNKVKNKDNKNKGKNGKTSKSNKKDSKKDEKKSKNNPSKKGKRESVYNQVRKNTTPVVSLASHLYKRSAEDKMLKDIDVQESQEEEQHDEQASREDQDHTSHVYSEEANQEDTDDGPQKIMIAKRGSQTQQCWKRADVVKSTQNQGDFKRHHLCGECHVVTTLDDDIRPRIINEAVCQHGLANTDPNKEFNGNRCAYHCGLCEQRVAHFPALRFEGYEFNKHLSDLFGSPIFVEKWVEFTKEVRAGCTCQMYHRHFELLSKLVTGV